MPPDERIFTLSSIAVATPATRVLRLDTGETPLDFAAGQAALIGPAGQPTRVPYSIASAPAEVRQSRTVEFLIKVEAGEQWGQQFAPLAPGAQLAVRGPYGSFVLPADIHGRRGPRRGGRPLLFVAGGTGIAPIRAMIHESVLSKAPTTMTLLYSAKTADDFAYLAELSDLARTGTLRLGLHVTREAPASWHGERGRIQAAQLAPLVDSPDTLAFVCGPVAMVAEVPQMLRDLGLSEIRVEEW